MNRFKNILLFTDDEHRRGPALDRAVALARRNGARLTLLEVLRELPPAVRRAAPQAREVYVEQRLWELDDVVEPLRASGLEIQTKVTVGTPFLEVIRRVISHGHDLVMKTAIGPGGDQSLFGTTALHLMRKCPCPVWVVKPTAPGAYRRILAAIGPVQDEEPEAGEEGALNRLILDLATSLARNEGSELHIVHAWELYGEQLLAGSRVRMSRERIDGLNGDLHRQRSHWLESLLGGYDLAGIDHHLHLVKGEETSTIVGLSGEVKAELVIMGTVSRTGVAGLLIGNTAERVLGQVDASVLTVKPQGFVSPVQVE